MITGPSGSGKSSLAFETVYAEGQRRYMQSLSTYARQFLEQFQAPDADSIENIPPTIALEQINPVRNSRATVGTSTETYDYLRLLFEKVGVEHCHGRPMERLTYADIVERIVSKNAGKAVLIGFFKKLPRKKEEATLLLEEFLRRGLSRVWVGGDVFSVEEKLKAGQVFTGKEVGVLVDRIRLPAEASSIFTRLSEAVRNAAAEGGGFAQLFVQDAAETPSKPEARSNEHYSHLGDFTIQTRCTTCGRVAAPRNANAFSFNSPLGACGACNGFGNILEVDPDLAIPNKSLSIRRGAVDPFTKPSLSQWQKKLLQFCKDQRIDEDLPYKELSKSHQQLVWEGSGSYIGVRGVFRALEKEKYKMRIRVFVSRYTSPFVCSRCEGKRLNWDALSIRVGELNIAEICELSIGEMHAYLKSVSLTPRQREISEDLLQQLFRRLEYLTTVGLEYLTLNRLSRSLSGGEYQRILLATQLSQGLTDTLYVLDEPSIGLHPKDTQRLLQVLERLKGLGNSILLVEHDPEVIEWADHVIEMGPGAGSRGGEVLFSGTQAEFSTSKGLTANSIRTWKDTCREAQPTRIPPDAPQLTIEGASSNNLKNVSLHLPLGKLTAITGVSGSGKSTLIVDTLYQALQKIFVGRSETIGKFGSISGFEKLAGVELVDQAPIGKTSRSNPVTFLKAYDDVRRLFAETPDARAKKLGPSDFSFNVEGGRCDKCEGDGRVRVDMVFMEDVFVLCPECEGKRFKPKTLQVRYKGKNIHEVLQMTIDDALEFFGSSSGLRAKLTVLKEVGLGYLQVGQPGYTLSGGEAQRLKIAKELSSGPTRHGPTLFILDEPTTGLHFEEIRKLISVFGRLISHGHTVVVIEHNVQMICAAEHVIDLGPDGGDAGGSIVDAGTPKEIAQRKRSYTGQYLAEILGV